VGEPRRRAGAALLTVAALALTATGAQAASVAKDPPGDAGGPLDMAAVSLRQDGSDLVFAARTAGSWRAGQLVASRKRSLCLRVAGKGSVCVGTRPQSAAPGLIFTPTGSTARALAGTVRRSTGSSVEAKFAFAAIRLAPGALRWNATSSWKGTGCPAPAGTACVDAAPDSGTVADTIRSPIPTGCVPRAPFFRFVGPRRRKLIALTFDDGPSLYTPQMLSVLERNHVHATFFLVGNLVRGNEALLKRMLRDGDAIGNHTFTHANVAHGNLGQLTSTTRAIQRATGGYTPCVFRPPYGAFSNALISQAQGLGMNTIYWTVDPSDYTRPGTGTIVSRDVGGARPGAIILNHDGGGPRDQTVAAIPRVISILRSRGYSFVTVPELLGLKPVYG
jgi:peptidoglycan-N-acetylglucosamine deacetylase